MYSGRFQPFFLLCNEGQSGEMESDIKKNIYLKLDERLKEIYLRNEFLWQLFCRCWKYENDTLNMFWFFQS